MNGLYALRTAGVLLLCGGLLGFAFASVSDHASPLNRYFSRYVAYLERKLRNMFITTRGRVIATVQAGLIVLDVALSQYFQASYAYFGALLIAVAPAVYIERLRTTRLLAIESKIDGFILALANALKTTPSIGSALGNVQPLLAKPLDQELELALKEMRVGSTLDQAMLNMASRIQSRMLDATLSGLLIGRQVGGDLSKILETTAATLREMARLQGIVRSKTAEGKAQLIVLALFPAVILFGLDTVSHGYFDPLGQSVVGWVVVLISLTLWVASIVFARRILSVNL